MAEPLPPAADTPPPAAPPRFDAAVATPVAAAPRPSPRGAELPVLRPRPSTTVPPPADGAAPAASTEPPPPPLRPPAAPPRVVRVTHRPGPGTAQWREGTHVRRVGLRGPR